MELVIGSSLSEWILQSEHQLCESWKQFGSQQQVKATSIHTILKSRESTRSITEFSTDHFLLCILTGCIS